jgi:hypothetical protein
MPKIIRSTSITMMRVRSAHDVAYTCLFVPRHVCIRLYSLTHYFLPLLPFSEYSKLSMGPLWAEILDHITPVLNDEVDTEDRVRPPAKLAIYSGYDSTIMQLLATLGAWDGTEWPPYASMVLIEVRKKEGKKERPYWRDEQC